MGQGPPARNPRSPQRSAGSPKASSSSQYLLKILLRSELPLLGKAARGNPPVAGHGEVQKVCRTPGIRAVLVAQGSSHSEQSGLHYRQAGIDGRETCCWRRGEFRNGIGLRNDGTEGLRVTPPGRCVAADNGHLKCRTGGSGVRSRRSWRGWAPGIQRPAPSVPATTRSEDPSPRADPMEACSGASASPWLQEVERDLLGLSMLAGSNVARRWSITPLVRYPWRRGGGAEGRCAPVISKPAGWPAHLLLNTLDTRERGTGQNGPGGNTRMHGQDTAAA